MHIQVPTQISAMFPVLFESRIRICLNLNQINTILITEIMNGNPKVIRTSFVDFDLAPFGQTGILNRC